MAYTLITSASSGIGLALAREFAKHGHNLIITARNEEKLNKAKEIITDEYSVDVVTFSADLSKEESRTRLFEYTESNNFVVDILVNNAGFGDSNAFIDATWQRQKNMVDLNITALMHLTYLYAGDMRKRNGGKILNLSSVAAFCAGPNMSVYYASKAFVLSFSQALTEELKQYNIGVTAICPGPTATGFEKNAGMKNSKMFTAFGAQDANSVARCAYNGLMKNKAVVYHSAVTVGFNIITRLCTRKFARKTASKLD